MTLEDHKDEWQNIQLEAKALSLRVYDLVNVQSNQGHSILCERIRHDAHTIMSCLSDATLAPNVRLQCTYMGVSEDKIHCLAENLKEAGRESILDSGVVDELIEQCQKLLREVDKVLYSLAADQRVTCLIEEYELLWSNKSDIRFKVS